ncbi:MAG: alpha/beta fold hydrolase [Candidatus Dormibacteria bacterium]
MARPLVLLHGFLLDRRLWSGQLAALAVNRMVVAPDLPGHGADHTEPLRSVAAAAAWLAGQLDQAGVGEVDLCGLSMGGYIAFEFLRRHPRRVARLLLADTRSVADSSEERRMRDRMAMIVRTRGAAVLADSVLPMMIADLCSVEARVLARRMLVEQPVDTVIADLELLRDRPDSTPYLAGIDLPTLVVVGSNDRTTPPHHSEAMAAAIPGARLVRIEGAGHLPPLETPAEFNRRAQEFLDA